MITIGFRRGPHDCLFTALPQWLPGVSCQPGQTAHSAAHASAALLPGKTRAVLCALGLSAPVPVPVDSRVMVSGRVALGDIQMTTHCSPHYPARRWQHCRMFLPVSVGVRVRFCDEPNRWVPLIVTPYLHGTGCRKIFFPRCYRRGLPLLKGWRW